MRLALVVFGGLMLLFARGASAADASGLDVTIEVLGRDDRIDDRIVNRIDVPGVAPGGKAAAAGTPVPGLGSTVNGAVTGVTGLVEGVVEGVVPLVPLLRYDEWVQQKREAERERQRDSQDRSR